MIKLGLPPFHFWIPLIATHINWIILFLNLTIQKIIPFYMFSLTHIENYIIILILILCSIIPPIIILNLINLKSLLTYSSINQSSWLMLLIFLKNSLWLSYFLTYSFIYIILFYTLSLYKYNLNHINLYNNNFKIIILIFILNIAGLPPFSFFTFKWFRIFLSINNTINLFFILILIILRSFIILYLYINISYIRIFLLINKPKILLINLNFFNFSKINLLLFIIIFIFPLILSI